MSTVAPIVLRAERLVAGGDALSHLDDGRVAFVAGALPGELVAASIRSERRDFATLDLVDVIEPSPARVFEPCAFRRAGCGGCGWMHIDPAAQLDAKVGIVAESLRRIGRLDAATVDEVIVRGGAVPPIGYRTTVRVVGLDGGGVGFREANSANVVEIDGCLVAHPNLAPILNAVEVVAGVELTVRTSASSGAVNARWTTPRRGRRPGGRGAGGRASRGSVVRGLPSDVDVGDRAFLHERVAGHELRVSAASFFQSGPEAAELLVDAVGRAGPELSDAAHAVDAYGGIGLFAATAMVGVAHVTLVESQRSACRDAAVNLEARSGRGGRSVEIVEGELLDWRPDVARRPIEVVVADPGRPGLARPGVEAIARCGAPVLVLVSCDPVSLARDASLLRERGYRIERVEVLDAFPGTPHVECVTRFVRGRLEKQPST